MQATKDPAQGRHDFNLILMVFLPKKLAGVDSSVAEYYDASDTRPLSISNMDDRTLCG